MTEPVKHGRRRLAPPSLAPRLLLALVMTLCLIQAIPARELPPIRESQAESGVGTGSSDDGKVLSLEDRVKRLEGMLEGQALVEMLVQIEDLQKNVQELRGQNEVYAHEVEGIKKRQRDLYMDIDRRLRQLMETPKTGASVDNTAGAQSSMPVVAPRVGTPSSAMAPPNTAVGSGSQSMVDPLAEKEAYRQAFNVLKDRHYEESITAFTRFLQVYPDGQYADNAVYWMGEAKYFLERFPAAIEDFKRVITQYPNSPKQPDALLKIGFSYYKMQNWSEARKALEDVVARFPTSTAATLAGKRLHQMKVDGH